MADPTPSYHYHPAGDPTADPPPGATRVLAPGADGTVGQTPAEAAASAEASGGPPLVPGFEVFGELGRGGMGVVYRARQLALDRDVAVKVLKGHHPADSPAARRFLDEAHVTGQLQHPGVPPVHHVGALPDGRPYLVMKLIKGETLSDLLARAPADRGRLVSAFAQVCQAVAYAHSRRVIHRDLKPANVMVGKFGEVQVMDWGLAKQLRTDGGTRNEGGGPDGSVPASIPPSELRIPHYEETHAGSVLGTPAYMAPEQAGGEVEKVDERADVFGLGAILCVVLTGAPPYTGADPNDLHLKAIRGQTGECFARLDGCGADPELVALCKRCLATDRDARPRDADAVAKAVSAHLAAAEDRARRADLDRVRAEGELAVARLQAAEQRRRRRARTARLAALVLTAAVAGGAWWLYRHEEGRREADLAARRATTAAEVDAALQTALALKELGWSQARDPEQWAVTMREAFLALERAKAFLKNEPADDLRDRVREAERQLADAEADRLLGNRIEACLGEILESEGHIDSYKAASRELERLLRVRGLDLTPTGRPRTVAWANAHPLKVSLQTLMTFLGAWHPDEPLRDYFTAAGRDIDPVREAQFREWVRAIVRQAVWKRKDDTFARLSGDPVVSELAPTALALLGMAMISSGERELGLRRLSEWQAVQPNDFWLNVQLAKNLQRDAARRPEALRYATAAVALRPRSPRAHATLAEAYLRNEEFDKATAACDRALRWDANYANAHTIRGFLYEHAGDLDAAVRSHRRAVELSVGYSSAKKHLDAALKKRSERGPKTPPGE